MPAHAMCHVPRPPQHFAQLQSHKIVVCAFVAACRKIIDKLNKYCALFAVVVFGKTMQSD